MTANFVVRAPYLLREIKSFLIGVGHIRLVDFEHRPEFLMERQPRIVLVRLQHLGILGEVREEAILNLRGVRFEVVTRPRNEEPTRKQIAESTAFFHIAGSKDGVVVIMVRHLLHIANREASRHRAASIAAQLMNVIAENAV